jgi:hypothetical protein
MHGVTVILMHGVTVKFTGRESGHITAVMVKMWHDANLM